MRIGFRKTGWRCIFKSSRQDWYITTHVERRERKIWSHKWAGTRKIWLQCSNIFFWGVLKQSPSSHASISLQKSFRLGLYQKIQSVLVAFRDELWRKTNWGGPSWSIEKVGIWKSCQFKRRRAGETIKVLHSTCKYANKARDDIFQCWLGRIC